MTRGPLGRNPDLPRPYSGGALGANRGSNQFPERNRAHDIFTRSSEGRRYNNGIVLHEGIHYSQPYFQRYHSSSSFFFGFYSPAFSFSTCYYSPYSYYYDVCPPYIYRSHCFYYPPPVVYIEVPIYVGGTSYGYDSDRDDYYLSRGNYSFDEQERESGLDRAVDDIREAFRFGNIEPLVQLTDPNIKISVFRKGKYEYSMSANDYLDMTRDMLRTTETVKFDLYRVRRRAAGVYVVSGRHEYNDRDGRHRTVYVSFVLERVYSRWTLTQVGTAPDRIQEF